MLNACLEQAAAAARSQGLAVGTPASIQASTLVCLLLLTCVLWASYAHTVSGGHPRHTLCLWASCAHIAFVGILSTLCVCGHPKHTLCLVGIYSVHCICGHPKHTLCLWGSLAHNVSCWHLKHTWYLAVHTPGSIQASIHGFVSRHLDHCLISILCAGCILLCTLQPLPKQRLKQTVTGQQA